MDAVTQAPGAESRIGSGERGRRSTAIVAIVVPVLNDAESLEHLISALDQQAGLQPYALHILVVDDGSFPPLAGRLEPHRRGGGAVARLRVVTAPTNLGHQRAIALGLVEASAIPDLFATVVMDADGEDRPEDVARLLQFADEHPDCILLAQRSKRSEGLIFKTFYALYRCAFYLFTGRNIHFGNFCLIPAKFLRAITHSPATWNNLAASLMRARLPTSLIKSERGVRYAGRSKMTFVSLAIHGLSAISVYTDVVLVRVICGALAVGVVTFLALGVVVGLRVFTGLAIPGWASYVGVSLLVILFQAVMFATIALFQFLSLRSVPGVVPALYARQLLSDLETGRVD